MKNVSMDYRSKKQRKLGCLHNNMAGLHNIASLIFEVAFEIQIMVIFIAPFKSCTVTHFCIISPIISVLDIALLHVKR